MDNKKVIAGGVKRIDDLGRIVIPKSIRYANGIAADDRLEILSDGSQIVLRKYNPSKESVNALQHAEYLVRYDDELDESSKQIVLQKLKEAQDLLR